MYKDIELADLHDMGTDEPMVRMIIPKEYCKKNKIHYKNRQTTYLLAGDTLDISGRFMKVKVITTGENQF